MRGGRLQQTTRPETGQRSGAWCALVVLLLLTACADEIFFIDPPVVYSEVGYSDVPVEVSLTVGLYMEQFFTD